MRFIIHIIVFSYIDRIESVQRKFLGYLLLYVMRCRRYHYMHLMNRRSVSDILALQKITNGDINGDHSILLLKISKN